MTDASGQVAAGVTVQAHHDETGNVFNTVTDANGMYRLRVRTGLFTITGELQGLGSAAKSLELLAGQAASVDLQLSLLAEKQAVTQAGAAVGTAASEVSGNIDKRQAETLPASSRTATTASLALLASGNRTTAQSENPVQDRQDNRDFQLNVDGQQVTQNTGISGQPLYSRDSIEQFQFISNRFDVVNGRSAGVQVLAVTKSGTNQYAGSLGAYFRTDKLNHRDNILNRVVPMSEQQVSGTFGGPIVKDKLHFFVNYEHQRNPYTSVWTTPYPAFNISLSDIKVTKMGVSRLDWQLSPKTRLMLKGSLGTQLTPFGAGSSSGHPSSATRQFRETPTVLGSWVWVPNDTTVNEVKIGYARYSNDQTPLVNWNGAPQASRIGRTSGAPIINWSNFKIGAGANAPQWMDQIQFLYRDDLTHSFTTAKGRHDVKIGGEVLWLHQNSYNCRNCWGVITSRQRAPSNLAAFMPAWDSADTWNLNAMSPTIDSYQVGIGQYFYVLPRPSYAAWMQDDWAITDNLTLNLGVRYDLIWNAFAQEIEILPWLEKGRPQDTKNFQPRLGFAYELGDKTVLRGGGGLYYGDTQTNLLSFTYSMAGQAQISVVNDGRADFLSNPFNGPIPTYEQAKDRFCSGPAGIVPGCLRRDMLELAPFPNSAHLPVSVQGSVGVAHIVSDTMAFQADYVYQHKRHEKMIQGNINLTWNPATGANYPWTDISRRANPAWGAVGMDPFNGRAGYHGLQASMNRRMSKGWQLSANYTLAALWDAQPRPLDGSTLGQLPDSFPLQKDLGDEYTLAPSDQRHRMVVNGIVQLKGGLMLTGLYFFGSGERVSTNWGGDLRLLGGQITESQGMRLRPDGTIVPRNSIVGEPVHRVDARIQQRVTIGGVQASAFIEVYNVFNRTNYGSYIASQSDSRYGQPTYNANQAYAARSTQLGFRLTF